MPDHPNFSNYCKWGPRLGKIQLLDEVTLAYLDEQFKKPDVWFNFPDSNK